MAPTAETLNHAEAQVPPAQSNATTADQMESARHNMGDNVRASWRFSTDSVRANIHYMRPEAKELLVWAFMWCIDPAHPIRFEDFCERVGYDTNTFYKVYNGKLRHPTQKTVEGKPAPMDLSDAMLKELRTFRRTEVQRAKLGRKKFVMTPTAKRIWTACDLARESQTPVFIQGASHIGKTEALKEYCAEHNHGSSRMVELQAINGLHGLIKATAIACGISPNRNAADLTESIMRALTPDMILVFDEIHLLANTYRRESFFACMEWIRRLYDFRQFGLVLTMTELGFKKVEVERKRELEQIFRRGVHRVNLGDRPTIKDVQMILAAWGVELPARHETVTISLGKAEFTETPYKMIAQLSQEQGLKAIVERLRYATKFAADGDTGMGWEHIVRAHATVLKNAEKPNHGWDGMEVAA